MSGMEQPQGDGLPQNPPPQDPPAQDPPPEDPPPAQDPPVQEPPAPTSQQRLETGLDELVNALNDVTIAKRGEEGAAQEIVRRQTSLDTAVLAGDQATVQVSVVRSTAVGMIDSAKDVLDDIRDELLS